MHIYETRQLLEDPAGAAVARQVFAPRVPAAPAGLPASVITSGLLAPARGGTGADLSAFTAGDVLYVTAGGVVTHDAGGLAYSAGQLKVLGGPTSDQLRLGAAANYYSVGRSTTTGALDVTGTQAGFTGLTVNGPLALGGTAINSGFYIDIAQNVASTAGFRVTNSTAGASAQIQNQLKNDLANLAYYGITSSTYTGFAPINGGRAFWMSNGCIAVFGAQSLHALVFTQNGAELARFDTAGQFQVPLKTKAGTPADADFSNPQSGMVAVDTTNSKLWVRVGSTWKSVTVA